MKPRVPKRGLAPSRVERAAQATVEDVAWVPRSPALKARAGWADDARRIAAVGDDRLVMGEFANDAGSTPAS